MPLFEVTKDKFSPIPRSTFAEVRLRERSDLQRLLRDQLEIIGDDLFLLAEEFCDWEESKRRVDLLAIDRDANLVVIELKRTSDGGHMELQALRYASMIAKMTFERACSVHADYLSSTCQNPEGARQRLLDFLQWAEPQEDQFGQDVRIVLVSEDFSKELTTAVLWLRERTVNIQCIRLRPHKYDERIIVDVQSLIPLPEAEDYQIQVRNKERGAQMARAARYDERHRFWRGLLAIAKRTGSRHASAKASDSSGLGVGTGIRGVNYNFIIGQHDWRVEVYIDRGNEQENKQVFEHLKGEAETIENTFGDKLSWEPLEARRACRIKFGSDAGGYRSPEGEWVAIHEQMIASMTKLIACMEAPLQALKGKLRG